MANTKSIDEVRNEIRDSGTALTEKAAARLFAKPFKDVLQGVDSDGMAAIFNLAYDEVASISRGNVSWTAVFNSYVAVTKLAQAVRVPLVNEGELELTELGYRVYGAQNRIGTLFSILRAEKNLSVVEIRSLLEGAYPIALSGLGSEARHAVFDYAHERGSADGALSIAAEYDKVLDLVTAVKPLIRPELPNHSGDENAETLVESDEA